MSDGELSKLIECARSAPPFRGLSGEDRSFLYLVAAFTGLRVGELASLTAASFKLEGAQSTVSVEAVSSKRRKLDVLPLHPDLVRKLLGWHGLQAVSPKKIWPGTWAERASRMIKADLERAGIAYETSDGVADAHALRHTFLSNLARSGANPKVIQELARHSTITLTMDRYAHASMPDLRSALSRLLMPSVESIRGEAAEEPSPHVGQHVGSSGFSGQGLARAGDAVVAQPVEEPSPKTLRGDDLAPSGAESPAMAMVSPTRFERATCGLGILP